MRNVLYAPSHQRAAMPIHKLTVLIFGLLALVSTVGGIVAIVLNATATTKVRMLGVTFTTGNVGVALVGMGLITTVFTIRAVLRNQHALASLPQPTTPVYASIETVEQIGMSSRIPKKEELDQLRKAVAARVHLSVVDREFSFFLRVGDNWYDGYSFNWEPFRDVAGTLRLTQESLPIVFISRGSGIHSPEILRAESPIPHWEITISPDCELSDIANAWLELLSGNYVELAIADIDYYWFPKNLSIDPHSLTDTARRFLRLHEQKAG